MTCPPSYVSPALIGLGDVLGAARDKAGIPGGRARVCIGDLDAQNREG